MKFTKIILLLLFPIFSATCTSEENISDQMDGKNIYSPTIKYENDNFFKEQAITSENLNKIKRDEHLVVINHINDSQLNDKISDQTLVLNEEISPELEEFNQPFAENRIIMYDRLNILDSIIDGELIDGNDSRELLRFSIPNELIQGIYDANNPEIVVNIDEQVEIIWHGRDPYCGELSRNDCDFVTIKLNGNREVSGLIYGINIQANGGFVSIVFDVRLNFLKDDLVFGTIIESVVAYGYF